MTVETKENGKVKKKILIGVAIAVAVTAIAGYGFYEMYMKPNREPQPPSGDGKYTVTIEPNKITMKVNSERNIAVIFTSTGFEGYVVITLSHLSPICHGFFLDEPGWKEEGYFLSAFDTLNVKATITFTEVFSGDLWLSTCGNYETENEIWVNSPSIQITVTP